MSSLSETAWKVVVVGSAAFWIAQGVRWLQGMRRLPRLSPDAGSGPAMPVNGAPPPAHSPSPVPSMHYDAALAIIVPACNEENTVGPAMRSLLAHAPEGSIVIAVDDRSTDATGARLDRLAAENPHLRVLHITDLPRGWLGKTHAIQAGTRLARRYWGQETDPGDGWFLFTDADVVFADGGIGAALRHARARGLDHLTLYPRLDVRGFWETTFTSAFMFLFGLAYRIWAVNDPKSDAYVGIGAFNLVRASSYERMGTHQALALEVADDVGLGEAMRRSGARQEAALGRDILCVRWQHSLWGLVTGLEKNAFAGVNYSAPRVLLATVGILLLNVPFLGVWTGHGGYRAASVAALAMVALIYAESEALGGPPWPYFLTFPLGTGLFVVSLWRSAALALSRGGIVWRDTFYPLAELRAKAIPDGAGFPVPDDGVDSHTGTRQPAPGTQELT